MEHKTITAESTSDGAGCRDKHRRLTGNNSLARPVRKNSSLTDLVCHALLTPLKFLSLFSFSGLTGICRFAATWYWSTIFSGLLILHTRYRFDLLILWHRADRSFFGCDQIGRGVSKMEHLCQIIKSQPIQSVFQHVIQHTGAEGIPRSRGLNDAPQLAGGDKHPLVLVVGITPLRPRRHIQ